MLKARRHYYEILAWKDVDTTERQDAQEEENDIIEAHRSARKLAAQYGRVEINRVSVSENDDCDILGAELVASWENGKRIS